MLAVYPTKAAGRAGSAVIRCIVKTDGLLRACKVEQETLQNAVASVGLGPNPRANPS